MKILTMYMRKTLMILRTLLLSNINYHPSAVRIFYVTYDFTLPREGERVAPCILIEISIELKNFITLKILLCTLSHKIRMEKYYFEVV